MLTKDRQTTKFKVTRYNTSGKFYDDIIVDIPVRRDVDAGTVYMYDAIDFLIENKYNEYKNLVVDHEDGYPHLIFVKR